MQTKMWRVGAIALVSIWAADSPALAGSAILYQGPPPDQGLLAAQFVYPDTPSPTSVTFELHGSAFSKANQRMIGLCVEDALDMCGPTARVFANAAQTHLSLVPAVWTLAAPRTTVIQISVIPMDAIRGDHNSTWDRNDWIVITARW